MDVTRIGLVLLALVVGAAACAQPLSNREKGALGGGALGAGAGAIIGSQKGHAAQGAAIGGALGGLAGAVLGDQTDKQEAANAATQEQLEQQKAELARNQELIEELKRRKLDARGSDRGVVVNLPDILFDFDKATLTRGAGEGVADIADVVTKQADGRRLAVEGHTDAIGSPAYNQRLSEERARTVASALSLHGVSHTRVSVKGFGASSPVAPNHNPDGTDNPDGRARNRRVEVVILN